MDYKQHVIDLKNKCDAFLRQVSEIGNECAFTDCAVEEVLKSAKSLHRAYYGEAELLNNTLHADIIACEAQAMNGVAPIIENLRHRGLSKYDIEAEIDFRKEHVIPNDEKCFGYTKEELKSALNHWDEF